MGCNTAACAYLSVWAAIIKQTDAMAMVTLMGTSVHK